MQLALTRSFFGAWAWRFLTAASLRARLMLLVTVALLPVVALLVAQVFMDRSFVLASARQRAVEWARLGAEQQDEILQEAKTLLAVLSRVSDVRSGDQQACHSLLRQLVQDHPRMAGFALVDASGKVTCAANDPHPSLSLGDRPHIQRLLAPGSQGYEISNLTRARSTGRLAVFVGLSLPLTPDSDRPPGAIIAALNLNWLRALSGKVANGANVAAVVDVRTSTVIGRYPNPEQWAGRQLSSAPALSAYRAGVGAPGVTDGPGPDGVERIYGYAPLPGTNGNTLLIVGLARDEVLGEADRRMRGMLCLLGAAVVVALSGAWLAAWSMLIRPVGGITETATRLACGEAHARVALAAWHAPELQILARTLNTMAQDVEATQAQLRMNEGKLLTYIDHLADGVLALRVLPAGTFICEHANSAARNLFGLTTGSTGAAVQGAWSEVLAAALSAGVRECMQAGALVRFEAAHLVECGDIVEHRVLQVVLAPVCGPHAESESAIELLLCSVRDVTRETELEAKLLQAQRMEAVGQLTAGVAHDFNNMLQAQMSGLELLLDVVAGQRDATRYAEMAIEAGEKGAQLTHSLLAFSRQQVLRPEAVQLPQLLDRLHALLSRTIDPRIALCVKIEPGLAPPFADPAQLESALLNLCLNARDSMQESGGGLQIEAYGTSPEAELPTCSGNSRWIVLAVSDEGCGIAPDVVARVCEPFFTTKEVGKGSGLGLSMVQGFVEQSGGELKIRSRPGTGTRVEMWLPGAVSAGASVAQSEITLPFGNTAIHGRVLLVDDDPAVRELVGERLESAGFTVTRAENGEQATAALRAGLRFDALVTDYAMPGMTGGELIQAARRMQPDLPALIITGYAEAAELGEVPASTDVLHKPFRSEELAMRVAALMQTAGVMADATV